MILEDEDKTTCWLRRSTSIAASVVPVARRAAAVCVQDESGQSARGRLVAVPVFFAVIACHPVDTLFGACAV